MPWCSPRACGKKPETTAAPQPNADSIAAADRLGRTRWRQAEADRLAREEAERIARQRDADSLAALSQSGEAVRDLLATMIHFDFDRSIIRADDLGVLDQKVAILQANPELPGSASPVTATSAGRTSTTWPSATAGRRPPSSTS